MKSKHCLALVWVVMLLFSGCTPLLLPIGAYRSADRSRDDMAMVYGDLIILQVKAPRYAPGGLTYWNWGGKYTLDEDGTINLDMDKETARNWKFYFEFLRRNDGIVINDLENNTGVVLQYEPPKLRRNNRAPVPQGSTGVDPRYSYPDMDSME